MKNYLPSKKWGLFHKPLIRIPIHHPGWLMESRRVFWAVAHVLLPEVEMRMDPTFWTGRPFFLDEHLHKIWHTNGRCLDMLLRMFVSAEIFACWKVELWTLGGMKFLLTMNRIEVVEQVAVHFLQGELCWWRNCGTPDFFWEILGEGTQEALLVLLRMLPCTPTRTIQ